MKDYFLLSRPYTLVEIVLLGLLANVIATKKLIWNVNLLMDIAIFLCFWVSFVYFTEIAHRETNKRGEIPIYVPLILFLIGAIIVALRNLWSLLFIIIAVIILPLYFLKGRSQYVGPASFLVRGIFPIIGILTIISLYNIPIVYTLKKYWQIFITIFLLTSSRNLIGDIRDYKSDKYSFPRKYGKKISFLISGTFLVLSGVIINDILVIFPLFLLFAIVLFHRNAFFIHRIYVLTSIFFLMNYIMLLVQIPPILNDILFLGVILNFTYKHVPRAI
ncbi:MAG: hypothetical protein QXY62_04485 [Candidatus Altiarchaeota archaeon]